ncbi:MAG: WD40 repeat domain-containing protein, partial [Candidatus Limnocylindria bacterium]
MRALRPIFLILALASSCSSPAPRVAPTEDVPEAPRLARDAGAILLQLSAYDYALAGALAQVRERTVAPERYAVIAHAAARAIADLAAKAVGATAPAKGARRDRVVGLADALTDLAKDVVTYADGGDPASFATAVSDVRSCWARLRALAQVLPPDDALARTIERGTSFLVAAEPSAAFALTVGPFATATEAADAARRIGQTESVSTAPPFIVRIGTFGDRISADAAAGAAAAKGFSVSLVSEEARYTFSRGGPSPDAELWREPAQAIDTSAGTRRVALSPDGNWLATGADDGTVAIFSTGGALRA